MPSDMEIGSPVKCRLPGKRSFRSDIVALRPDEDAVDVRDPKNGGRRTIRIECVELIKPKRPRK